MIATLIFLLFFYFVGTKNMSLSLWGKTAFAGGLKLVPIALILLFAFGIGEITTELKTGNFLASLVSQNLGCSFLSRSYFIIASLISLSTGTSWELLA